jgi:hypothetical protein
MANAITDDTPNMIGQLMDGGVQVSIENLQRSLLFDAD